MPAVEAPAISQEMSGVSRRLLGEEKTLENLKGQLDDVNRKVAQGIRVRLKIISRKSQLIQEYEQAGDPKQRERIMSSLSVLLNNERKVVDIFRRGISEGIAILGNLERDIKPLNPAKSLLDEIELLRKILNHADEKIGRMEKRIGEEGIESRFLATGKDKLFKQFKADWFDEIKYDREIIEEAHPDKVRWIKEKADAASSSRSTAVMFGGTGTGVAAAAGGYGAMTGSPILGAIAAVGLSIIAIVSGIALAFSEYEQALYRLELREAQAIGKLDAENKKYALKRIRV
jgi:hypothetical protein